MAEKRKADTQMEGHTGKRARSDTTEKTYNIFVGSWNVNQKNPKTVDWKKWLCPPVTSLPETTTTSTQEGKDEDKVFAGMEATSMVHDEVDIYVISFQEVLTVDNVSANPKPPEVERFANWNAEFMQYISTCRSKPLVPIFDSSLGGTGLFIFGTPDFKAALSEEDSTTVEVGRSRSTIKGGVCYRCLVNQGSLPPLPMSFAGVHFTADQETENVEARIRDYQSLNDSTFPEQNQRFLADHSFSCLVGDVNFRINLPRQEIADRVEEGNYGALYDFDQLNIARREGKAFVEYSEGALNFPPTYKYNIGSDQFDLSEPPGKRSPAYTDRIFFQHHVLPATPDLEMDVTCHHYTLGRLTESDHKPVSCYVTLRVGPRRDGKEEGEGDQQAERPEEEQGGQGEGQGGAGGKGDQGGNKGGAGGSEDAGNHCHQVIAGKIVAFGLLVGLFLWYVKK